MAPSSIRKALGAVKDQTSIGIAKVSNTSTVSDLDVAIVKATWHNEFPAEEKHIREILSLTCYSRVGRIGMWIPFTRVDPSSSLPNDSKGPATFFSSLSRASTLFTVGPCSLPTPNAVVASSPASSPIVFFIAGPYARRPSRSFLAVDRCRLSPALSFFFLLAVAALCLLPRCNPKWSQFWLRSFSPT